MKHLILGTLLGASLALPAFAQDAGDAAAGEADFRKCKACHMIQDDAGTDIVKGGRTGPNLYNIAGRKIASEEGYSYGDGLKAAAEANPDMVWNAEELVAYVTDPGAWVKEKSGNDSARSKMTFKMNKGQADIAAYLASATVSPGAAE